MDRPNDGAIAFRVDLSPMACMAFEYVQPATTMAGGGGGRGMGQAFDEGQKLLSNRILRILERTLMNGGAIDVESLCVESGKWVWRLHVDVTVLDHGGNLVDACILSAVAALRHFRKPEVRVETEAGVSGSAAPVVLHSDEREPTPLPMHHTPLTVTFALFSDPSGATTKVSALIDPTYREELVMDGTSTFSFNKYGEICSLDFPGGCELKPSQFITCAKLGKQKCVELCDLLEKSLSEANEKAAKERMDRLRRSAGFGDGKLPLPEVPANAPFVEQGELMEVDQEDLSEIGSKQADTAAAIAAAEEESYRIQALDYAQGHVAAKVKDDDVPRGKEGAAKKSAGGPIFEGSLMSAMLKSARKGAESSTQNDTRDVVEKSSLPAESTKSIEADATSSVKGESKIKDRKPITTETMNVDSDSEEEEKMVLQSEFESVSLASKPAETESKQSKKKEKTVKSKSIGDDDEIDLSMAVKKKKSKKSKKKK